MTTHRKYLPAPSRSTLKCCTPPPNLNGGRKEGQRGGEERVRDTCRREEGIGNIEPNRRIICSHKTVADICRAPAGALQISHTLQCPPHHIGLKWAQDNTISYPLMENPYNNTKSDPLVSLCTLGPGTPEHMPFTTPTAMIHM